MVWTSSKWYCHHSACIIFMSCSHSSKFHSFDLGVYNNCFCVCDRSIDQHDIVSCIKLPTYRSRCGVLQRQSRGSCLACLLLITLSDQSLSALPLVILIRISKPSVHFFAHGPVLRSFLGVDTFLLGEPRHCRVWALVAFELLRLYNSLFSSEQPSNLVVFWTLVLANLGRRFLGTKPVQQQSHVLGFRCNSRFLLFLSTYNWSSIP